MRTSATIAQIEAEVRSAFGIADAKGALATTQIPLPGNSPAARISSALRADAIQTAAPDAVRLIKAGHAHRIPLSNRAVALLKGLPQISPFVFPGYKAGKPLSGMAMEMQLRRMDRNDITVHGFRSTFRDRASEQTSFPHETAEHALAHRISDKAEAAYRRGDQFEKRRELMEAWAQWCEPERTGKVVKLKRKG